MVRIGSARRFFHTEKSGLQQAARFLFQRGRGTTGAPLLVTGESRQMTDRKPTAGFWITVALVVVLVGYPLSFGPACWLFSTPLSSRIEWIAWEGVDPFCPPQIYWPIGWLAQNGPGSVGDAIFWWARLFQRYVIALPTS